MMLALLESLLNHAITNVSRIIGVASIIWGIISFFTEVEKAQKIVLTRRTALLMLVGVILLAIGTDWVNDIISRSETPSPAVTDASPAISEDNEPAQESDFVDESEPMPPSLASNTPNSVETNAGNHTELGTGGSGSVGKTTVPPVVPEPTRDPAPIVPSTPVSTIPPVTVSPVTAPPIAVPPVQTQPITVHQVVLDYTEADLTIGDTKPLLATVAYSDGTNDHSVVWTSSNPNVATVDSNGTVTALSAGSTQIIAQASKNNVFMSASCAIRVTAPPTVPTGYSIRLSTDHAMIAEQFRVYVTPYEDDVTEIHIFAISPSGKSQDFLLSESGMYLIDTEVGTWTIYASVTNSAGTYTGSKETDSVTIEISGIMDKLDEMFPGLW